MARKPPGDGNSFSFPMSFPAGSVSFDPAAFDELVRTHGVAVQHFRSMRCPVGLSDPDDLRRPHPHHEGCSNGFLYTLSGVVTVGFMGNSKESRFVDEGRVDGSTATVVLPRFYDDLPETRVELCQFDRLYLLDPDVTVVNWQTFAAHSSGVDRLQFPAVHVSDLVDSRGERYLEGVDFEVRAGQINWLDQRQPGVDPDTGKGVVCSARYSYRPFWYVQRMVHEVRVVKIVDEYLSETTERMPQMASIQRETFFEKEQRDDLAPNPDSPRQKPGPGDGGFGPR